MSLRLAVGLAVFFGMLGAAATAFASGGVVVSEFRPRGPLGGNDEFVELYNASNAPVDITGWKIKGSNNAGTVSTRATIGSARILGAGCYVLFTNATATTGYSGSAVGDYTYLTGITDDGGIALTKGDDTIVDQVGMSAGSAYKEGTNLASFGSTNGDRSYERKPGGSLGNATDTDDNASDFAAIAPSRPQNALSACIPSGSAEPALSIDDISMSEGNSGTTTFTFTVSLSSPAGAGGATFDIATADNTATVAGGDYVAKSLTGQTIAAGDSSSTFDVLVNGDAASESNETFFVNVTNATGATLADGQGLGTITDDDSCGNAYTPVHTIQGSGLATPNPGTVTTEGVVVGDFQGTAASSGFYLQDTSPDADPATSEGIFVFTGSADAVSVGDRVRVTGYARERFNQTTINGSNSNSDPVTNILVCSTGNSLPEPTDVTLPFDNADSAERYEGMLVRFPQNLVIAEYFNYDRFGEIVLAQPLAGEPRPFSGTALDAPGAAANARTAANALSRITLDDNQSAQNPPFLRHPDGTQFTLAHLFRGGDHVQNAVGVLGWDFNLYRIFPTQGADYTATNPRPAAPEPVGGSLRVAAMNTLNFFVTADYPTGNPLDNKCGPGNNVECRGWDSDQATEFDRQRTKLLSALSGLNGDIIGLNELENSTGVEPLASITSGLPGYDYINTGTIGTDAIKVGLIYRPTVVTPVGSYKLLTTAVDPRFIDTKSRPSLAQTFQVNATGARFTVVVNHLKSKGSDCNDVGDPDLGDGQGNCSQTRRAAAEALVDWLATDPTGSGDPDFVIVGDLNSYAMEQTISEIKEGSDDVAGTGDDFTNLIAHFQGPFAYSYTFDGQAGYLDHALANTSLFSQITGATEWHINSDEADVLDYDTSFKPPAQDALYEPNQYRTSDHDAVVIGLNPTPPNSDPTVDAGGPYSVEEGSSAQVCADGDDADNDTLTYAWDLDDNGSFETAGQCATYAAGADSAPAQRTIKVHVSDGNGGEATDSATVNVIWHFTGFLGKIANPPAVNTVKAGDVAKLEFALGGNQGLAILADGYPASADHACGTAGPDDATEATTPGKKGLTYDAKKGTYTYSWDTDKAWKGTCRTFVLKLADGTTHTAEFQFGK